MKNLILIFLLISTVSIFEFCHGPKKAQASVPKVSYASDVQTVIAGNCSPCHVGANAKSGHLDSYDAAKSHIDEIISRIQRNPNDKGFMPFKHPKLSDSTIAVFVKWKADGIQP
jgi:hypothetical protein